MEITYARIQVESVVVVDIIVILVILIIELLKQLQLFTLELEKL